MNIILAILLTVFVLCVVAFIKNEINYRIRLKWIEEIYKDADWFELRKKLPEYGTTFRDLTLWKYKSFNSYIETMKD